MSLKDIVDDKILQLVKGVHWVAKETIKKISLICKIRYSFGVY